MFWTIIVSFKGSMHVMGQRLKKTAMGMLALMLAGCDCAQQRGGIVFPPGEENALKVGQTTQQDLVRLWGTPSTVSVADPNTWYYGAFMRESMAFMPPKLTESKIYVLKFDQRGVLCHMDTKSQGDMQEVAMVGRTTPPRGQSTPVMRQFFRNLGNATPRPKL